MDQRRGVPAIGWIGLGLSILAVALLFVTGWLFNEEISVSAGNAGPDLGDLWLLSLLLGALVFVAAVTLDTMAGRRGPGGRIVGITGGVIMLSPLVVVLISLLLSSFGVSWP